MAIKRDSMAINRDTTVNRNIDTDTAEGHKRLDLEEGGEPGKKAALRPADGLDDEAEGHRVIV